MGIFQEILSSKELWTIVYSAIPVTELRATIPLAITVWHVKPLTAFILAVIGNSLPILVIILGLNKIVQLAERYSKFWTRVIEAVFRRTRRKTSQQFAQYGLLALFLFVAVPLPMTGAWTGSIAAWLFGVPARRAFWPIFAGVIVAGIIVTSITVGTAAILK
ncbi:MAG TPA: small multi-drug export protein [bacterium]|jgi:uncharacterized membrane protein|nr:small multi-drug export protein [bacterium]HOQ91375.1 small multi-drug export protein [bacterium]HPL22212.1 small multi-drug export protein [bacterium]